MTIGIVTMSHDAPHRGEVHPDGDEILYVISGKLRVTGESEPNAPIEMGPGTLASYEKASGTSSTCWRRRNSFILRRDQTVTIDHSSHVQIAVMTTQTRIFGDCDPVLLSVLWTSQAAAQLAPRCVENSPERRGEVGCSIIESKLLPEGLKEPLFWT